MVTIHCEAINKEMLEVAKMISKNQNDVVKLITPTKTLEVQYEKEAEDESSQEQT